MSRQIRLYFLSIIFQGKKSKKGRARKSETETEPDPEPETPAKSSDDKKPTEEKKEFKFEFQIGGGGKDPKKNPKKPKKGDDAGPLDERGFHGDAASQVELALK